MTTETTNLGAPLAVERLRDLAPERRAESAAAWRRAAAGVA